MGQHFVGHGPRQQRLATRRAAARDLLALSLRVRDQFELVDRIENLENRLLDDAR